MSTQSKGRLIKIACLALPIHKPQNIIVVCVCFAQKGHFVVKGGFRKELVIFE